MTQTHKQGCKTYMTTSAESQFSHKTQDKKIEEENQVSNVKLVC